MGRYGCVQLRTLLKLVAKDMVAKFVAFAYLHDQDEHYCELVLFRETIECADAQFHSLGERGVSNAQVFEGLLATRCVHKVASAPPPPTIR